MTQRVDDFNSAQTPFEMTLEEMAKFWEDCARAINAPSSANHIPRELRACTMNVSFLNEKDPAERSVSLSVEKLIDGEQSRPTIMALHIMESRDGVNYDLLLNLDPYMKIAKNEDFVDGTLRSIKSFPKTWVGARAMFKECEEKVLNALKEGDGYPYKENQRIKAAGASDAGPQPNNGC